NSPSSTTSIRLRALALSVTPRLLILSVTAQLLTAPKPTEHQPRATPPLFSVRTMEPEIRITTPQTSLRPRQILEELHLLLNSVQRCSALILETALRPRRVMRPLISTSLNP